MSISLSGKSGNNLFTITGKNNEFKKNIPSEIKELKIKIMKTIILPLISRQWKMLYQNIFALDFLRKKVKFYYNVYKLDELLIYIDILNILEVIIGEHIQLEDLEKKLYGANNENTSVTSLIYKTTMIRLKPEYELYDNIIGKPKKDKNQVYNSIIIEDIQKLLLINNIDFNKIKNIITSKYENEITK
jgi:hypothetical protein